MDNFHDERKGKVRLAILKAINRVSGFLLPENVLHADVNLHVVPPALLSEYRGELADLEQMGLVVIVAGSLGGVRKIKLTDAGRAEVAANL